MRRFAILAAFVLALAGCGGSGNDENSSGGTSSGGGNAIAQAAEKTANTGSVKASFVIASKDLAGTGTGLFNNDKQGTGKVTMAVRSQGQTVNVDTIVAGNVIYIRSPAFAQGGLPAGKQWVRLDLAQLAQQQGVDLGSLVNSNPSPTGALAYLQGSTGDVQKVGTETVDGVDTTHYKATIDLEKAAQKATGKQRDSIRRVITVSGVKKLPVEVWIDDDGYVRKVAYVEHSGRNQSSNITMQLRDFGPHASITSPPSSSVIDFQDLIQQGGG